MPQLPACLQVQAANLMIDGRAEEDAVADGRDLESVVESYPVAQLFSLDDPSFRFGPGSTHSGR